MARSASWRVRRAGRAGIATVLGALLLACAACGGAGDGDTASGKGGSAGSTDRQRVTDRTRAGAGFPVTVHHKFGTTTIPSRPHRVVTVGYNGQDFALALGVIPIGVRGFLGYDAPDRPWAAKQLDGHTLPTVGKQELDLEKIAALKPDLILAINGYLDRSTYRLLAGIAPTVAQSDRYAQGATPWARQTLRTGRALGRLDRARRVVAKTRKLFARARARHPEFAGKTAAFSLGGPYRLGLDDYRTGWLDDLGFEVTLKGGKVSMERLSVFDVDVLVLEGASKGFTGSAVFRRLDAVREGRVVNLGGFDDDFAGALGFNSPLSLPYALKIAVPRIAAAVDGDPATPVEPYP